MTNLRLVERGSVGYVDICDRVRARIARGELRAGDRLPPVRACAAELGVNVNTVARAYAELARQGVVVSQAGGGTHVATPPDGALFRQARDARLGELVGGVVLQALGLGYRPEQIEAAVLGQLARWQAAAAFEGARLQPAEQAVVFAGSHDLTLDLLAARLQRREPPVWLRATYGGSLDGLMALAREQAHLAGCHLLDELTGDYNVPFVARLLPGQSVLLVTLALREQGLMIKPGNPKRIASLADLGRPDVLFAARQRGSGTRLLLEHELRQAGLKPDSPRAGERFYATHVAVAGAVAEGGADVGLGIRGAARAYGLEFVPIATERYELAVPERLLDQPQLRTVLDTLAEADFQRTVQELGGYDVSQTGRIRVVNSR